VDPKAEWRKKSKLKELARIERGIMKSVRRAESKAALIVPKALAYESVAYPRPDPITAHILARISWRDSGELWIIPVTTLCRAIALNDAQRLLKGKGFTHFTVLDLYEGPPRVQSIANLAACVDGGRYRLGI
jgi:hypothetical protein